MILVHGNAHYKFARQTDRGDHMHYFSNVHRLLEPFMEPRWQNLTCITDPYEPARHGYLWLDEAARMVWVGWTQAEVEKMRGIFGYQGPSRLRILNEEVLWPPPRHPAAEGYRQPLPNPRSATAADLRRQEAMPPHQRQSVLVAP